MDPDPGPSGLKNGSGSRTIQTEKMVSDPGHFLDLDLVPA